MTTDLTTAPSSDAAALMATITRAATDASVDAEKMERLWALYERMDSRRAEQAFAAAMKSCQEEMPRVHKNRQNTHQKNTYADLDAVIKTLTPVYTKHGFSLSFGNGEVEGAKCRIICHVSHDGGHSRMYQADIPVDSQGAKNPTQGYGSTMSYGRRYLTLMIFNASTTDDDDAVSSSGDNGCITIEQRDALAKIIEENGFDIGVFLKWAQVETLADLPAANYQKALNALMSKVQAKGAAK